MQRKIQRVESVLPQLSQCVCVCATTYEYSVQYTYSNRVDRRTTSAACVSSMASSWGVTWKWRMECRRVSARQLVKSSSHLVISSIIRSSSSSIKTNGLSCSLFLLLFLGEIKTCELTFGRQDARTQTGQPCKRITGQAPGLNSKQQSHITFWQMIVFISDGKCLVPDELWSLHQKGFATAATSAATTSTATSESIGLRA